MNTPNMVHERLEGFLVDSRGIEYSAQRYCCSDEFSTSLIERQARCSQARFMARSHHVKRVLAPHLGEAATNNNFEEN